jgi:predicted phage baseplate assembly protein
MQPLSTLKVWVDGEPWEETDSLLKCGPLDQKFSLSIDEDGFATILFGDGKCGLKPDDDSLIVAEYRIGSGSVGNVGKDTLTQFDDDNNLPHNSHALVQEVIDSVTNPLPATGGIDIESIDDAKIAGPKSLKDLERAVTLKDYEDLVKREFQNEITNAKARFVYTGSWDTIFVSVDLKGEVQTNGVDQSELFGRIRKYLDSVKMIGYEVQIEEAIYVPIEIGITVYLRKYFDSEVLRNRVFHSLSNKDNNSIVDGTSALFHPDNFTFGDPVYASKIYEVLKNAPEVKYGIITTFRKRHTAGAENSSKDMIRSSSSSSPSPDVVIAQRDEETKKNLELGYIPINNNEIITIDNDPSHPENGTLILNFIEDNKTNQEGGGEEEDHGYGYSLWDDHNSAGRE